LSSSAVVILDRRNKPGGGKQGERKRFEACKIEAVRHGSTARRETLFTPNFLLALLALSEMNWYCGSSSIVSRRSRSEFFGIGSMAQVSGIAKVRR
jgi:hypothetical protein